MILYLNLLPKSESQQIRFARVYLLLKREFILMIALLVILNAAVIFIKINLSHNLRTVDQALAAAKEKHQPLITESQNLKARIANFQSIQTGFVIKSAEISRLLKLVPPGIKLYSVAVDSQNSLFLDGTYKERADIITFKNNLADGFVDKIEFPISNLLKQTNGSFSIKGHIICASPTCN